MNFFEMRISFKIVENSVIGFVNLIKLICSFVYNLFRKKQKIS